MGAIGPSAYTLHYYKCVGLPSSVRWCDNGHRVFRAEDMTWLEFLPRLCNTGMPTAQIQTCAMLRWQGDSLDGVPAHQHPLELHAAVLEVELRAWAETLVVLHVRLIVHDGIWVRIEAVEGTKGSASPPVKSKHQPKRQPSEDAHDPGHAHRTSRKPHRPVG